MQLIRILVGNTELYSAVRTEAAGEEVEPGTRGELPLVQVMGNCLASGNSPSPAISVSHRVSKLTALKVTGGRASAKIGNVRHIADKQIRAGDMYRRPRSLSKRKNCRKQ